MRRLLMGAVVVLTLAACSGGTLAEVDWSETTPLSGTAEGGVVTLSGPGSYPLAVIDGAVIPADTGSYTLVVPLEYRDVEGQAYLEMWSVFSDGGRFFSRTLAEQGGLAAITGTSNRAATLPFDLAGEAPPSSLEVNLVLPGAGVVEVGSPSLVAGFTIEGSGVSGWWNPAVSGWIGAILGTTIGAFGWLIGRRASRGRDVRSARMLAYAGVVVGAILLLIGLVAVFSSQPYVVYYPLLLAGAISVIVLGSLILNLNRLIQSEELRQMKAADLTG